MKQRKKGMQDIDVTKKEEINELSEEDVENINGGIVCCLGDYPSDDEYQVTNKNGTVVYRTGNKRDAENWAKKNNCDTNIYYRY